MHTVRLRHHTEPEITNLLRWCAKNAHVRPAEVTAIGLAYIFGLNEHQIASAEIADATTPVRISVPLAKRRSEIRDAERIQITLDKPEWLACAASTLTHQDRGQSGALLYTHRGRTIAPVTADYIRRVVARACPEATGTVITVSSLVATRSVHVARERLYLALRNTGYSTNYADRLMTAKPVPRVPERIK